MTAIPLTIPRATDSRSSAVTGSTMTRAELERFHDGPIPARAGRTIDRQRASAEIRFLARQVEFHRLAALEWDARGDVASAQRNRKDAALFEKQRGEWVAYLARLG
jgi:hypothetical protein